MRLFTIPSRFLLSVFALCLAVHAGPVLAGTAHTVLLDAHFNDKTPGEAIGTGGAALGEPYAVPEYLMATVVEIPGLDNALEVERIPGGYNTARMVTFQFIDNVEITSGVVDISVVFTASALGSYQLQVREAFTSTKGFVNIRLSDDGRIRAYDAANQAILIQTRTYAAGVPVTLRLQFDMDAGTHSAWVDDEALYQNISHGITDRGVGKVMIGFPYATNYSPFLMDDLFVLHEYEDPTIFKNGFESD